MNVNMNGIVCFEHGFSYMCVCISIYIIQSLCVMMNTRFAWKCGQDFLVSFFYLFSSYFLIHLAKSLDILFVCGQARLNLGIES